VRGRRAGAAVLRPEINHRPLPTNPEAITLALQLSAHWRVYFASHSPYVRSRATSLTFHIHRKPLRCISAPFVYLLRPGTRTILFRTGKSVSSVLGQDVWSWYCRFFCPTWQKNSLLRSRCCEGGGSGHHPRPDSQLTYPQPTSDVTVTGCLREGVCHIHVGYWTAPQDVGVHAAVCSATGIAPRLTYPDPLVL
jgi:hypothetical protein